MSYFLIATNNAHKCEEFKRILSPEGINCKSAKELGIDLGQVEETGETFAENARIKALSAYSISHLPSIADDSGLCVDALSGRPGVYSARYGGEEASSGHKISLLLSELDGVPTCRRTAHFSCCICCVLSPDKIIEVSGRCDGYIGFEPDGSSGFGYDPIFYIDEGRSFASVTAEQKDVVSHRGKALTALKEALIKKGLVVNADK